MPNLLGLSRNATGALVVDGLAPPSGTLLLGDQTVGQAVQYQYATGQHIEFKFVAVATGVLDRVEIRTAPEAGTATSMVVGVYSDLAGAPNARLGKATYSGTPPINTWIGAGGLNVPIVSGTTYWLAAIALGGTVPYRATDGSTIPIKYGTNTDLADPAPSGATYQFASVGIRGLSL